MENVSVFREICRKIRIFPHKAAYEDITFGVLFVVWPVSRLFLTEIMMMMKLETNLILNIDT